MLTDEIWVFIVKFGEKTSLVGKYIGAYYLEVGDWCVYYLHRVGRLFFEAHYILSIFGFIEVFTQVVKLRV